MSDLYRLDCRSFTDDEGRHTVACFVPIKRNDVAAHDLFLTHALIEEWELEDTICAVDAAVGDTE